MHVLLVQLDGSDLKHRTRIARARASCRSDPGILSSFKGPFRFHPPDSPAHESVRRTRSHPHGRYTEPAPLPTSYAPRYGRRLHHDSMRRGPTHPSRFLVVKGSNNRRLVRSSMPIPVMTASTPYAPPRHAIDDRRVDRDVGGLLSGRPVAWRLSR